MISNNSLGLTEGELNSLEKRMMLKEHEVGEYNFVENAIEQYIDEDLDYLISLLENLKEYRDPAVFRVIPEYLDEALRSYGVTLNEYGKTQRKKMKKGEKYTLYPVDEIICHCCGAPKKKKDFYVSYSECDERFGVMPYCSDCVKKMAVKALDRCYGDIYESIVLMCQKLDVIAIKDSITATVEKASEDESIVYSGEYFEDYLKRAYIYINLPDSNVPQERRSFAYTNLSGVPFKKLAKNEFLSNIYDDKFDEGDSEGDTKEISRLKLKWGDFPLKKLRYLEKSYQEWYEKHDIGNGKADDLYIKQICYEEYALVEARENDADQATINKMSKNFMDLTKEIKLTPKKIEKKEGNGPKSLGEWIKIFEKDKPIILKDPDAYDPDKFQELSDNISGAMARTLLKSNEYTRIMEKNLKKYDVRFKKDGESENGE